MSNTLSNEELEESLEDLSIWGLERGKLATKIEFGSYRDAVFFANIVFTVAEELSHHPEVKVEYDAVSIDLWSHEEEGLTEKDIEVAKEIESKLRSIDFS